MRLISQSRDAMINMEAENLFLHGYGENLGDGDNIAATLCLK